MYEVLCELSSNESTFRSGELSFIAEKMGQVKVNPNTVEILD